MTEAAHPISARIERHDFARKTVQREVVHDPPTPFVAIVRRTEDRDPAGLEDARDRNSRGCFRLHSIPLSVL
jgi:hypothetical protein